MQLVRPDPSLEKALREDPEYIQGMAENDWPRLADVIQRVVGRTLAGAPASPDELQWGGYFLVDQGTRELVGTCAFKSSPTEDGTVEIAYFTFPAFEGRGYATQMAGKLIALASTSTAVRRVIAHTLPQPSASTRVLQKAGMTFIGEVIDPDDGLVWRWEVLVGA